MRWSKRGVRVPRAVLVDVRALVRYAGLLLVLVLVLPQREAAADLMLAPTRVVLERNQRAAQLDLINNGSETVTYRVHLVNRRMNERGEFSAAEVPGPGEQFADALLRYSPRQVVLAPGASQAIRISLRKPPELAPGEYRSHLLFERIADSPPAKDKDPQASPSAATDEGLEIRLTTLVGVSIPVIVRHGETAATVTLANVELQRQQGAQPAMLSLEMHRSGNRSVYGDLIVGFTPVGGTEQSLARINGVAVYTPNPLRRAKILLPTGFGSAAGTLRVIYRERAESGGKTIAEGALQVR